MHRSITQPLGVEDVDEGDRSQLMPSGTGPVVADLDSRRHIHDLVVGFYREVVFDDLLAPVFDDVAEVDWAVHIPKLVDYWCRALLEEPGYTGAILAAHRRVHDLDGFRIEHVDRWYLLWAHSVDSTWAGPRAEQAKRHAARVATSLARQLLGTAWQPPETASTHPLVEGTIP